MEGESKVLLGKLIRELEHAAGFRRVISLCRICLESGLQSLQNFNKQFYQLKEVTPSDYRKQTVKKEL
jgi:AraC-like DNA-binding protein